MDSLRDLSPRWWPAAGPLSLLTAGAQRLKEFVGSLVLANKLSPGLDLLQKRGFFGFEEEDRVAAKAEAIIRCLGAAADLDGRLVDHILVLFRRAAAVIDVPAEALEERVDELDPRLRLAVLRRAIVVGVVLE